MSRPSRRIIQYFGMDFIKEECRKDKANAIIFDSAVVAEAQAEEKPAEAVERPKAKRGTKARKASEHTEGEAAEAEEKPKTSKRKATAKSEEKAE